MRAPINKWGVFGIFSHIKIREVDRNKLITTIINGFLR
jgi:hypothetical protein